MNKRFATVILCLSMIVSFSSSVQAADNDSNNNNNPLRIAVAANFAPVLKILLTDFEQQTGIKSQMISGASGAMYLQLKHGAPFDIFLSADERRPLQLEQAQLIVKNSRKTYATGQLALLSNSISEQTQQTQLDPTELLKRLQNRPKHFAIANPKIAPYGKAAQETLTHLNLWQDYQAILIKGININQTFMQIRTKAVNSGLVAHSQLVLNNLPGFIIPSEFHQPIQQQLVILKSSNSIAKAQKLSDFLLQPSTQEVIVRYGYAKS